MELLINAVAATAELERCHYLKAVQDAYPDGTRTEFIFEGDVVARQGSYEKLTYGNNTEVDPDVEILNLEGVIYRRFAEGGWEKDRAREQLFSMITSRYPWIASKQFEQKATSQASIPNIPGWGPLDIQSFSFTDMGEVLMGDATTRYFVGIPIPKPVDHLVYHKTISLSLWVGTEDGYLHKIAQGSETIWVAHPDAPPGTVSFRWIGTDYPIEPEEEDRLLQSLQGTHKGVSEMVLSRFNDPAISLPKP